MKVLKILDLGCGNNKYKSNGKNEVIGLDIVEVPGVNIIHDLNETPYPFDDNYFHIIIVNHVLEHIQNFFAMMGEIYRILKPNGILRVRVPHFSSINAYADPTHVRFFALKTFKYLSENHKLSYYYNTKKKINFKIISIKFNPENTTFNKMVISLANLHPHFYERYISRFISSIEMEVILQKMSMV